MYIINSNVEFRYSRTVFSFKILRFIYRKPD